MSEICILCGGVGELHGKHPTHRDTMMCLSVWRDRALQAEEERDVLKAKVRAEARSLCEQAADGEPCDGPDPEIDPPAPSACNIARRLMEIVGQEAPDE